MEFESFHEIQRTVDKVKNHLPMLFESVRPNLVIRPVTLGSDDSSESEELPELD